MRRIVDLEDLVIDCERDSGIIKVNDLTIKYKGKDISGNISRLEIIFNPGNHVFLKIDYVPFLKGDDNRV